MAGDAGPQRVCDMCRYLVVCGARMAGAEDEHRPSDAMPPPPAERVLALQVDGQGRGSARARLCVSVTRRVGIRRGRCIALALPDRVGADGERV